MSFLSEEDIRTKVVYEWLKDCGFSSDNILLEYNFKVKFGKQTKNFRPRTDVLIKSVEGLNLLVVEVKAPNHKLNNDDIDQAVSYARLLKDGIAPFTILTNGKDSKIFDSVTKEEINGTSISSTHLYVRNGFKPTTDGLDTKLEAAEYLITISNENLISFCQIQVQDRISILKGDDINSGKKYIPSLYVERKESQKKLRTKLFENKDQLLLVIGNPQQGKTCFMCHNVEQFLSNGCLSLFYPAINLNKGLLLAIKEDFEWCFGNEISISQLLRKVNSICLKQNRQLFIFIDGWDEMAKGAIEINEECKRLNLSNISIVLSLTIPSLDRLLIDSVDNLTYVGEEVGLNQSEINSLSKKLLKNTNNKQIIQIENFNNEEGLLAKELYKKKFKIVSMPDDQILYDPFYLRITCETYTGKYIPTNLNRTDLIKFYLNKKAARRNIGDLKLLSVLSQLAEVFYQYGRPVSLLNCIHIFEEDLSIAPWKESGILIQTRSQEKSLVDFYNTNILNYSIAHCYKKWGIIFIDGEKEEILNILKEACTEGLIRNALLWFLGCPENCHLIQKIFGFIDLKNSQQMPILKLLVDAIMIQNSLNDVIDFAWIENHLKVLNNDNVIYENEELPALIYTILKSINVKNNHSEYKYWVRLLLKTEYSYEEFDIEESFLTKYYDYDLDTKLFYDLIFDQDIEIASRAAMYFSNNDMYSYLEKFDLLKKNLKNKGRNFKKVLESASGRLDYKLRDSYYGYFCKGWLLQSEFGEPGVREEFYKMNAILPSIISTHSNTIFSNSLKSMLEDLKRIGEVNDEDIEIKYNNPNQLNLDL